MFALRSRHGNDAGARAARSWGVVSAGFVLPRWLRKPARLLGHAIAGDIEAPRFAMAGLSAVLVGAFVAYGVAIGGHTSTVVQSITARTGFAIDEIRVSGNRETSEIDIFDRVGLDGWTSLVGFDVADARRRIESLPWVESATVRKVYPSTLEVRVVERMPFAIWQHGSLLSLIERDGRIIAPLTGALHVGLPLVVGAGAQDAAAGIVERIAAIPELSGRVRGFVRVSDRRWDLRLENDVTVKLPETGVDAALDELLALDLRHGLLSRDIVAVDLRFADRLVVRLSPDAAVAREAALKEQLGKRYRPAERRI